MKNSAQLHGFIPIAPVGTRSYSPQQYQNIQVRGGINDADVAEYILYIYNIILVIVKCTV